MILFPEIDNSISIVNPPATIICDDEIIMDDILLFPKHDTTVIHYFSCVSQVFTMYRLLFKLYKYDFFEIIVEFCWHDLTTLKNFSAESKLQLIEEYPLPTTGTSLLSFIDLCTFNNRYCPWFETNLKLLLKLQRYFHHAQLPLMAWPPFCFITVNSALLPHPSFFAMIAPSQFFLRLIC